MHRHRRFDDLSPEIAQRVSRRPDSLIDFPLGCFRDLEGFAEQTYAEAFHASVHVRERLDRGDPTLSGIQAVRSRYCIERQCTIADVSRQWTDVIERSLDGEDAGVRNESVGWFVATAPAEARGKPDRAALIASERQVHLAARHHRCAPTRGAAREAARVGRIEHLRLELP